MKFDARWLGSAIELSISTYTEADLQDVCRKLDEICLEKGDDMGIVTYKSAQLEYIWVRQSQSGRRLVLDVINDKIPQAKVPDAIRQTVQGYLEIVTACGSQDEIKYAQSVVSEVLQAQPEEVVQKEFPRLHPLSVMGLKEVILKSIPRYPLIDLAE